NSMTALQYFLDLTPMKIRDEVANESLKNPEFWGDIWSMALQQSQRILNIVRAVAENVVQPADNFDAELPAESMVRSAAAKVGLKDVNLQAATDLKPLHVHQAMAVQLFEILLKRAQNSGAVSVKISEEPAIWGTPGVK